MSFINLIYRRKSLRDLIKNGSDWNKYRKRGPIIQNISKLEENGLIETRKKLDKNEYMYKLTDKGIELKEILEEFEEDMGKCLKV